MGLVNIKVVTNQLPEKLSQKGADLSMIVYGRSQIMAFTTAEIVRSLTPKGEHCPNTEYPDKSGNLESAVKYIIKTLGAMIYIDKQQAPYVDWAIKRGPVHAKGKASGGSNWLHFCKGGQEFFRKSVGPVDKPDFFKLGYEKASPVVVEQAESLGSQITEL